MGSFLGFGVFQRFLGSELSVVFLGFVRYIGVREFGHFFGSPSFFGVEDFGRFGGSRVSVVFLGFGVFMGFSAFGGEGLWSSLEVSAVFGRVSFLVVF